MEKFNKKEQSELLRIPYIDIKENGKIYIDHISKTNIDTAKNRLSKLEREYQELHKGIRKSFESAYKDLKEEIKHFNSNYDTFDNMKAQLIYTANELKSAINAINVLVKSNYSKDFQNIPGSLIQTALGNIDEGDKIEKHLWTEYLMEKYNIDDDNFGYYLEQYIDGTWDFQQLYYDSDTGSGALSVTLNNESWSLSAVDKTKKLLDDLANDVTRLKDGEISIFDATYKKNITLRNISDNTITLLKSINKYR